jgi:hypothetical protein
MKNSYLTLMTMTAAMLLGTAAAHAATYNVTAGSVSSLQNALNSAVGGDTISLPAGTWNLSSGLSTVRSGSSGKYITIDGAGSSTILKLTSLSGSVFKIGHSYIKLRDMFLNANTLGTKGLLIEGASHGYVTNVTVDYSRNEAFKIRKNSQYWEFLNCQAKHPGASGEMYGEGFYVSDADQNWTVNPDNTGYITFAKCVVYKATNDGFDLKEGSHHIKIVGCRVDYANMETATTRGANGIYCRANYCDVINSQLENNLNCNDGGWLVLANDTTASNGVTYGNNVDIKNSRAVNTICQGDGNRSNVLIRNDVVTARVYSDCSTAYTGTNPSRPAASTFVEMTWSGEGGGVYGGTYFAF